MFSVYGRAGRLFRGSMEDLRTIDAMSALARSRRVASIGQDAQDHTPAVPRDLLHRSAMSAYAQTTRQDAQRHPLSRVDDIVTRNVVTISDTATVGDAWSLLADRGIGQVPVVGADGVLVGLLTRADLTRPDRLPGPEMHALVWRALLAQSVGDVMWSPVPSVAMDTDIRRVARVLLDTGLPGLPVVDDGGRVTGFVSRTDILRAVVADPPLDLWT
ncbi:MAG: CBS domain-containing protein [Burkholderiales bacterium]|nr:CBS domain-containing protein [Burkholderiales bacterium]